MRLWTLHPRYLDRQGLLALWREALLAKKVLQGKTKGYTQHPQLIRFKQHSQPLQAINLYLLKIWQEAAKRNYRFDHSKIDSSINQRTAKIPVTQGQINYEFQHLLNKLAKRDKLAWLTIKDQANIQAHSLFKSIPGQPETWEKLV